MILTVHEKCIAAAPPGRGGRESRDRKTKTESGVSDDWRIVGLDDESC